MNKNTSHTATINHWMQKLKEAGKRATAQRYAVCKAMVEHGGHPTVSDIFERVREPFPMISQATVYNTIDTLLELGLIHQLDIANHDHTHYDLDIHPHVNVVCRYCEYIADVSVDMLDDLLTQVSERSGCEIDHHAGMVVYGICPACLAAGKADEPVRDSLVVQSNGASPTCRHRRRRRGMDCPSDHRH